MAEVKLVPGKLITTREPDYIEMKLTKDEAMAIMVLVGKIGGTPYGTAREITDGLYNMIDTTGIAEGNGFNGHSTRYNEIRASIGHTSIRARRYDGTEHPD